MWDQFPSRSRLHNRASFSYYLGLLEQIFNGIQRPHELLITEQDPGRVVELVARGIGTDVLRGPGVERVLSSYSCHLLALDRKVGVGRVGALPP